MSVNHARPHVLVLPEDDADRQLANGFLQDPSIKTRVIQVLPPAGGWGKVRKEFLELHISKLKEYPERHLVLLIDFDEKPEQRTEYFQEVFPPEVAKRVYLLGTFGEPEELRKSCHLTLEKIGEKLSSECYYGESTLWQHELLQHNSGEVERLRNNVKPFLFA